MKTFGEVCLTFIIIAAVIFIIGALTMRIPSQVEFEEQCVTVGDTRIEWETASCAYKTLRLQKVRVNGILFGELVSPFSCEGMAWAIENGAACEMEKVK